jgi:hypothetical protein
MRQDISGTPAGQQRFADLLEPVVRSCATQLA